MYVYVCEDDLKPDFNDFHQLVWLKKDLVYGDWSSGPNRDGIYTKDVSVSVSKVRTIELVYRQKQTQLIVNYCKFSERSK
jgi:hypothetical protein